MKKSKIVAVCLIGILMVGGLVLVGCEKGMCDGRCRQNSDGVWLGCSVLDDSCAGECAAWKDWTNDVPWILSRGCDCH